MTLEEGTTIRPTIVARHNAGRIGALCAEGALIVLRGEKDACAFMESSGHGGAQSFRPVGVTAEMIRDLADLMGVEFVAMPEPWTGEGSVDFFRVGDFVWMLEDGSMEGGGDV